MDKSHTLTLLAVSVACLASIATTQAQVFWDRQAYGQLQYIPGHQGDPAYAYNYPNNNNWSQELTFAYDNSTPPKPIYETAPSNWSTDTYPTSGDVTLGNGGLSTNNTPTNLDRGVRTGTAGGVIVLNSLTIQQDGALNMEAGTTLTANLFNFQGNNNNDAVLTNNGGGGAFPILFLSGGGTMKKTTGTSTFSFDQFVSIQVNGGGTIAADAGALQLPGNNSRYAGGVSFNAATGALIDLAIPGAVDSAVNQFTGPMTGINTGGTVRLSNGWISTVGGTGGSTLNFGGNTFQWTGGRLHGTAADPFTNLGTINVTGAATLNGVGGLMNKGSVIQSGQGTLDLYRGDLTNLAGAVYDLRNDLGITDYGPFYNFGTFRKSAGTGTSVLDPNLGFENTGGTIQVDSGTLALGHGLVTDGGPGDGGTFVVAAGATLQLNDGTSTALYNGTYTGSGAGTVLLSGGELAAVRFHAGTTFNLPPGMFQWTGGSISTNSGAPFINAGTLTVAGPVSTYNYGSVFTNRGLLIQSGAGAMSTARGGIKNDSAGTYDIRNDLGYSGGDIITNSGIFQKSAGTGTSVIGAEVDNSGTINAASGTLQFDRLIQTGGTINLNGGNISSGQDITLNGGSLVGTGTITGTVRNNTGNVAPGHSPGKISISGSYAQDASGSLTIEIGGYAAGTEFDQLVVGGTAALGGTLNVKLINGFRPAVGDIFQIIAPAGFSGSFAAVNTTGFTGQVNYSAGGITFTITTVSDIPLNIATRLRVKPDPNELIGGFIITGTEPKKVIIRATGPSLSSFFSDFLGDPTLELFQGSTLLANNDNWKDSDQAAIEATGVAPKNDLESAIVRTLAPGAYTAVVRGKNGTDGIGLVEAYDLSPTSKSQFGNIATRGFVDTDNNVMIGGFIVGGNGGANAHVAVRAVGPSLRPFGIDNALADPTLELRDANGSLVKGNDNWKDSQQAEIEATGLAPTDDLESAIVASLPDGTYTAIVRGNGNTTGVGLVEVYVIP